MTHVMAFVVSANHPSFWWRSNDEKEKERPPLQTLCIRQRNAQILPCHFSRFVETEHSEHGWGDVAQ